MSFDLPKRVFDNSINDNLIVVCEDRSISVAFDPSNVDYATLSNATIAVKVKGAEDLHGNPTDPLRPISHLVAVASSTLETSSISFQVNLGTNPSNGPGRHLVSRALPSMANIQEMVAQAAHISVERVSVSPGNSNVMPSSELMSYYVHIKALNAMHSDTGHNSLTAYHTLCRNLTEFDGNAIFSANDPEIHFDASEKRADSICRTLVSASDHDFMGQEMRSLILDAATGDTLLMSRLDGTNMQLNDIAGAVHQTDM